jgi:hypothetical protein
MQELKRLQDSTAHVVLLRFILIFLPKDVGFDLSAFLSGPAGYFPLLCTSWRKSYMLKKAFKPFNKVKACLDILIFCYYRASKVGKR